MEKTQKGYDYWGMGPIPFTSSGTEEEGVGYCNRLSGEFYPDGNGASPNVEYYLKGGTELHKKNFAEKLIRHVTGLKGFGFRGGFVCIGYGEAGGLKRKFGLEESQIFAENPYSRFINGWVGTIGAKTHFIAEESYEEMLKITGRQPKERTGPRREYSPKEALDLLESGKKVYDSDNKSITMVKPKQKYYTSPRKPKELIKVGDMVASPCSYKLFVTWNESTDVYRLIHAEGELAGFSYRNKVSEIQLQEHYKKID